jgi:hypothetical protein
MITGDHPTTAAAIARELGGSRSTRAYRHAVIEIKAAGSKIKVDGVDCGGNREASDARCGGFSWKEAPQISASAGGAPRAQVEGALIVLRQHREVVGRALDRAKLELDTVAVVVP